MTVTEFPIEAGQIVQFARAIGDPNQCYYPAGLGGSRDEPTAPPTFVQASAHFDPDYALRPRVGEPWFGSGRTASGATAGGSGGGLHAEQRFEYHRALRAGDVLTAQVRDGRTWEKHGRRGGRLVFQERITEYRDAAGELVVTATSVGVRTEQVIET